jgi:hypothetical protein
MNLTSLLYISLVPYFCQHQNKNQNQNQYKNPSTLGAIGYVIGNASKNQMITSQTMIFQNEFYQPDQKTEKDHPSSNPNEKEQTQLVHQVLNHISCAHKKNQKPNQIQNRWQQCLMEFQHIIQTFEKEQKCQLIWLWGSGLKEWSDWLQEWFQFDPTSFSVFHEQIYPFIRVQFPWFQWSTLLEYDQKQIQKQIDPVSAFPCESARRLYQMQLAMNSLDEPSWWSFRGLAKKYELWWYS